MHFSILGPLEVEAGESLVEIRRGIPRMVLSALIVRSPGPVGTDALTELLWEDKQPHNPPNALQIQVSYLRKTLAAAELGADRLIVTRPRGYLLDVAPENVDTRRFEPLVRSAIAAANNGASPDLRVASDAIDAALALWRGDPLPEIADAAFAVGEATRLVELRLQALDCRADIWLAQGRHHELVGELARQVAEHPLRERGYEQLMLALYRADRQAEALRAYDDARRTLVEELGLEPGQRLQEIQRKVLDHDRSLDWTPPEAEPTVIATPNAGARLRRRRSGTPPTAVTTLLGRDTELRRIENLLGERRMVTLTGPAGAGKTRLAMEIAGRRLDGLDVVFVDLGGIADLNLVAATVAAAIGIPAPPDEDPAEAIATWFGQHPGLLVLDTCEHVLTAAGTLSATILREGSGSRVLTTSRRPLGIQGEIAWPVPPLALPPLVADSAAAIRDAAAVELFCERAVAVRPDFELTDENAADVAAICLALDGLPLAIELAAARSDVLAPASIRGRLENRFALLVNNGPDVAARQQTLRSAIDWSFHLLDDDQRRLFALLSVIPGTFHLDAVLAVAGDEFEDSIEVLAGLVRHSVVMVTGNDRYRLLDSLRAYAAEHLEDESVARRRHAEHYTELAEITAPHVQGPEQITWLDRARDDLPNFRAALAWCFEAGDDELAARLAGSLAWFWTLEGMLDEAVQVLERVTAVETAPPAVRARTLSGYGLLAASLGDLSGAQVAGARSVELARIGGDRAVLGNALNTLAVAHWTLGDFDEAAATHDEAIEHFEAIGDLWGLGVCMTLRARTALDAAEPDAFDRARRAVPAARAAGDRHVIGLAFEQLARIAIGSGDVEAAIAHATEALALQESIGYTEGRIAALHMLGRAHLAADERPKAKAMHLQALALATAISHAAARCEAVEDLACLALCDSPAYSLHLITAADRHREVGNLVRRTADTVALEEIRNWAISALGTDADRVKSEATEVTFDQIVDELLA